MKIPGLGYGLKPSLCWNKKVIVVPGSLCSSLSQAMSREWLETNGIGGFASSTICGMNTRRYHALLVAATKPPVGRAVLLSKIEETLVIDGVRFELSVNQFPGAIHPEGHLLQSGFRLDPGPVFTWSVDGCTLEKSVLLVQGENTVIVTYELIGGSAGRAMSLELRPLVAFRGYHDLTRENAAFDAAVRQMPGAAWMRPYDSQPPLYFAHDAPVFEAAPRWYHSFEYEAERQRGLDFVEDLHQPFTLTYDLVRQPLVSLAASTGPCTVQDVEPMRTRELARRKQDNADTPGDEFIQMLRHAAGQFIVQRNGFKTVIAGYPWFGDWGRDTMIALPGLSLATGRYDISRQILSVFAHHMRDGLVPNRFTEEGAADYNTIDATLWLIEAVRDYVEVTKDHQFVRQNLYAPLREVLSWHERGTLYGIRLDADGLLEGGEEGVQLTWMDAKIGDFVVTPRRGKPVEVQALWYNALRVMEQLAGGFGDLAARQHYAALADRARDSFYRLFWNDNENCLYDVVDGQRRDGSIRPNQIFAASLPNSMLDLETGRMIVDRIERELLTPFGLRTLSPLDPRYRGRYENDVRSRDTAYHQGTVWTWLIGPFFRARRRVYGDGGETRRFEQEWLANFRGHLFDAGLGQVSEIFDGDPPHAARGCIAQAWSVAEILRVALEQ
jgi:predicted glycogen debranching enzyme